MKKRYLLIIVLTLIGFVQSKAQNSTETELIYNEVNGVPVVEVVIGENTYRFLLDTGAGITCVSDRLVNTEELEYKQTQESMKGLGNNLFVAQIPESTIGELIVKNKEAIIMSADNVIFSALDVDGTIGANILTDYVVTFDSKKQTITLSDKADAEITNWETLKLWKNVPLFNIKLQGKDELYDVPALFDSGNGTGALGLPSVEGFEQWTSAGIINNVAEGHGANGSMVGGLTGMDKLYRGKLNDLHIGGYVFEGIPVMTGGMGYLLLCFKMTDLGKITIDYPNNRYNFSVYEDCAVWDGDNRPVLTGADNGQLRVAAVWGEEARAKLDPGNIISEIGNNEITNVNDSTPNIDKLILDYEAQNEKVTVKDKIGKVKKLPASIFLPVNIKK